MRFELNDDMINSLKNGAKLNMGVEHSIYSYDIQLEDDARASLINDLD